MGTYIHFTEDQKHRAGEVDLEEFLRQRGERLIRSGRDKRMESDHSVTIKGSAWYDHAAETGGGPVSFLQRFYRMSYPEAMQTLLGGDGGRSYPAAREQEPEPRKEFALPQPNGNMRRVYAYLMKQRGINQDVITFFAKAKLLYEDAEHHNCVFVGMDENGVPRHAHKRSTNSFGNSFRVNVEGSDPRYSFHHIGRTGCLLAFEAPIDMMSYITMHPDLWQEHSYVACCGTSIQPILKTLEMMPRVDTVFLCLDNDEAGEMACQRISDQLKERGIETERLLPDLKDWNEDLVEQNRVQEECQLCQTF